MNLTNDGNGATINARLQKLSLEAPEKAAFIFWDENLKRTVLTRQDVWDKSRMFAAFLRRHGILKGDVVCNTLPNSQERLITTYGAMLAGAVSMHGQKLLASGEDIIKNLKDAQAKIVLVNPYEENGLAPIIEALRYKDKETGTIKYQGLPDFSKIVTIVIGEKHGEVSWLQALDEEPEMYLDEGVTENDLGMIMTTSGSTGFAKVIPHTQKRLVLFGHCFKKLIHLDEDSVYYCRDPLGRVGGCPVLYPVIGLTRVLIDTTAGEIEDIGALTCHIAEYEKFDRSQIHAVDIELMLRYLDARHKHKMTRLTDIISLGGGPVSRGTMRAIGRLCKSITVMYGSTEFGVVYSTDVKDPEDYENSCCGYPAQFVETKIVDKDLKEVNPCEIGEVLLRGSTLFSAYMNDPETNRREFLADGWWRTSDIGRVDEKGQLFVYCRKSNVINSRGYLLYPGWMEARIDKHPEIKKSHIVGVPNPVNVEDICVCITRMPGSSITDKDVREYCNTLFLTSESNNMTPTPKYCLFFDSFPTKFSGKIDRKAIKNLALQRIQRI